ncbi:MAG: HAD family hydrolase [Spirochaetaceae bacterium]|jgi:phosphoglycolate phosphatase|nr:HAD family hydrolase [Spirochaetaceae bacterium]
MSSLKYSCVLFDLDGTLVDTIADIAAAMNHALVKYGYPARDEKTYRRFVGNGIRRLAYDMLPETEKNDSLAAVVSGEALRYYAEHPADYARPYPGITAVISELKRQKVKTAVLSNKPDEIAQLVIAKLFNAELFDCVTGERPGVARKPDPESSWEILAVMDRTPRQTMLAGDSEVDMETAKNIGCLPVGVSWGFRSVDIIEKAGAALIINRPEEILQLVFGKDDRL